MVALHAHQELTVELQYSDKTASTKSHKCERWRCKLIFKVLCFMPVIQYPFSKFCRYKIMCGCWAYDPVKRPNFSTLVNAIAVNLAQDAEYFIMSPVIPVDTNGTGCQESNMELNFSNPLALEVNSDSGKDTSF